MNCIGNFGLSPNIRIVTLTDDDDISVVSSVRVGVPIGRLTVL